MLSSLPRIRTKVDRLETARGYHAGCCYLLGTANATPTTCEWCASEPLLDAKCVLVSPAAATLLLQATCAWEERLATDVTVVVRYAVTLLSITKGCPTV